MTELQQRSEIRAGRQVGPDIARCLACYGVIAVHFFLHNGFYYEPVSGAHMFVFVLLRMGCMICVPTFLLLTGYLMRNKKLERGYYGKATKTIVVYVICSVLCILYRILIEKNLYLGKAVRYFFNYTAAPYGWYIEMYLGLFLLIPFLNILYHNIPTKKGKQALIATMLFLTAVPAVINVYSLTEPGWLTDPGASTVYFQLIPQWWKPIYPLTYYFIGAYVGEYGLPVEPRVNTLLFFCFWMGGTAYAYWRSRNVNFVWGAWCDWGSVFNVGTSVTLFNAIVRREYAKTPRFAARLLARVSDLTLGAYLLSYIFDKTFYQILDEKVATLSGRLVWFFILPPVIFLCSVLLSVVPELVYRGGRRGIRVLKAGRKKVPVAQ